MLRRAYGGALEDACTAWLIRTRDGLALAVVASSFPPPRQIGGFFPDLIGGLRRAMWQVVGLRAPDSPARLPASPETDE